MLKIANSWRHLVAKNCLTWKCALIISRDLENIGNSAAKPIGSSAEKPGHYSSYPLIVTFFKVTIRGHFLVPYIEDIFRTIVCYPDKYWSKNVL